MLIELTLFGNDPLQGGTSPPLHPVRHRSAESEMGRGSGGGVSSATVSPEFVSYRRHPPGNWVGRKQTVAPQDP